MPTVRFTVHTILSPADAVTVLTDFGPDRATRWPNVNDANFTVHERGSDWAEVTEGNSLGWERERYSWDDALGTVTVDTLDSNLWGPGSGWRYELAPVADGTDLHVTVTRLPNSIRGRLIAVLLSLGGSRTLRKQLESVMRMAEAR